MKPIENNAGPDQALTKLVSVATGVLTTALAGKLLRKNPRRAKPRRPAHRGQMKGGLRHG